jgi:hypothetical protein
MDWMAMDEPFECAFVGALLRFCRGGPCVVGALSKIGKLALASRRNWRANDQLCNFGHGPFAPLPATDGGGG